MKNHTTEPKRTIHELSHEELSEAELERVAAGLYIVSNEITGPVTTQYRHENWIELSSCSK